MSGQFHVSFCCQRRSGVAIQLALLAPAGIANAQSGQTALPAVTIDAPEAQARRAARKPNRSEAGRRPTQRTATASERQLPVVVITTEGGGGAASRERRRSTEVPAAPDERKHHGRGIEQTVNVVDTEDAVKYLPSLFVRKRNEGDNQPVLATRTWGVRLQRAQPGLCRRHPALALIANNNTIGAPRWGLVAPEQIERIDFLYGPFAAAYPGNSIGGVLQITTRMPDKPEFRPSRPRRSRTSISTGPELLSHRPDQRVVRRQGG